MILRRLVERAGYSAWCEPVNQHGDEITCFGYGVLFWSLDPMGIKLGDNFGDGRLTITEVCGRAAMAWVSNKCLAALTRKADATAKGELHEGSWWACLLTAVVPPRRKAHHAAVAERSKQIFPVLLDRHISNVITGGNLLSTRTWRELRCEIIRRDGRVCQELHCHRTIPLDFDLHIDHIRPRSVFPELSLDPSNLRVLCRTCNFKKAAHFQCEGQEGFNWQRADEPKSLVNQEASCPTDVAGESSEIQLPGDMAENNLSAIIECGRHHRDNRFKSVGDWEDKMVKEFGPNVIKILPHIWTQLRRKDP